MPAQHFLTTRWKSGYFAVTQVTPRVTVMLEEIRRPLEQSVDDSARIFLTRIEGLGTVGTLFGKVYLSTDRRRATFQHSLLLEAMDAPESELVALFHEIYGLAPDRTLYVLCNLLATREHWEGSPLVRSILFGEDPDASHALPRYSRAGHLIRAVLGMWPEVLRVLEGVGVEELDQLVGHATSARTTDPLQPAITEITEDQTEEGTAPLPSPRPDELTPAPSALEPIEPVGLRTELLSLPTDATTVMHPRETDPPGLREAEEAEPLPAPARDLEPSLRRPDGRRLRRALALAALFLLFSTGTFLLQWCGAGPMSQPSVETATTAFEPTSASASPSASLPAQEVSSPGPGPETGTPPLPMDTSAQVTAATPSAVATTRAPPAGDALAMVPCYHDLDQDRFGVPGSNRAPRKDCIGKRSLFVGDCDDANANVHPDSPETCDGIDNNCDNEVDNLPGCAPQVNDRREVVLVDQTRYADDKWYFKVKVTGGACDKARLTWWFTSGGRGKRTLDLSVKGGSASCVLPYLSPAGRLLDEGSCGDEYFTDEDWGSKYINWSWKCCVSAPPGSKDGSDPLECRTVAETPVFKEETPR